MIKRNQTLSSQHIFRIVSGLLLLSGGLPFVVHVLYKFLRDPQGLVQVLNFRHLLIVFFWYALPGVFSIILSGNEKKKRLILTIILGLSLFGGMIVSFSGIRGVSSELHADPDFGYDLFDELPYTAVQLAVCFAASVISALKPQTFRKQPEALRSAKKNTVNGVLHLIGGALLVIGTAAFCILLNGYYRNGAVYLGGMAALSAVLLTAGCISLKSARNHPQYALSKVYTYLIALLVMLRNIFQILIPWKIAGGYFMDGSGDVVIGRILAGVFVIALFIRYLLCFLEAIGDCRREQNDDTERI